MKKYSVTLSRAHKIITRLNEEYVVASKAIPLLAVTMVNPCLVSEEEQNTMLAERLNSVFNSLNDCESFLMAIQQIKVQLAVENAANAQAGISSKLGHIDVLNRLNSLYRSCVEVGGPMLNQAAMSNLRKTMEHNLANPNGRPLENFNQNHRVGTVSTEGFNTIKENINVNTQLIRKISDEVSDLNSRKITISLEDDIAKIVGLI